MRSDRTCSPYLLRHAIPLEQTPPQLGQIGGFPARKQLIREERNPLIPGIARTVAEESRM
jgi:hypothetical protein